MSVASFFLALVASALPVAAQVLFLYFVSSKTGRLRAVVGTLGLGAVAFTLTWAIEGAFARWSGLEKHGSTSDLTVLLYAILVAAPIEQALKVAATVPVLRFKRFRDPVDGIIFAASAGLGFSAAHNFVYVAFAPPSFITLLRALLAVPAHMFLAGAWGYALGRDPKRRLGARFFDLAWLGATLFNGIYDHIVFARGPASLVAVIPILLCIAVIALLVARDVLRRGGSGRGAAPRSEVWSRGPALAPPSIGAMQAALLRTERPLALRWIAFGALVTTGVITLMLVASVFVGNRVGVDFAAVDSSEGASAGAAPFIMLGSGALAAFPLAGYLVARASSARSVIEPALSAALAIIGSLVVLGLAAPISMVFALAFAPIAFGAACAGAWIGMTR